MRCRYCTEAAGWWRRCCEECDRLRRLFEAHRGADMPRMLDLFAESGVPLRKIDAFLAADPDGTGAVRDQIAADASNELLAALGQRVRQSATDVGRLRARGSWRQLDRRPAVDGAGDERVLTGVQARTKLRQD